MAVALAGLAPLAAMPAAAQAAPSSATTLSPAQVHRARDFWTAARMRRTRPLAVRRGAVGARPVRTGALASSASETVPDPTLPGFAENGAVFGLLGHGASFRCSGTSVDSPNLSLVVTAGHCVHDEGHWLARKWVFVPAYRYGERPFGTFVAHWLGTTPGWLNHENFNYDVGMAVVSRNERGQSLTAAVGADGIAWGLSPNQAFDVYGYPVAAPFNGSTLHLCPQARYEGHDLEAFLSPGPLELGVQCDISGGSSGGGWVIAGGLLDGVTSNSYSNDPTTAYGPYFGKAVARLFARASRVK